VFEPDLEPRADTFGERPIAAGKRAEICSSSDPSSGGTGIARFYPVAPRDRYREFADEAYMSDEEFNSLINGSLAHPFPMFAISRLILALKDVIEATGEAGAQALRDHCANREEQDKWNSEDMEGN
jgi:hypothetical protein